MACHKGGRRQRRITEYAIRIIPFTRAGEKEYKVSCLRRGQVKIKGRTNEDGKESG
jgi:hypothetical protein